MKNINYKQLKKYELGKILNDSGYQRGQTTDLTGTSSQAGYSMDGDAQMINKQILPSVLNKGLSMGGNISSIYGNYTTKAAAKAAGNGAKAGLNTLGYITAGAGAITGGLSMMSDLNSFNDRITSNQALQTAGINYNLRNGRLYKTYGGIDENGIMDVTRAYNKAGTWNLALDTASTAASLGAFLGPVGSAVAGLLGGVGGWLWGDRKSREREREERRMIASTKDVISGYNQQSEAEAASQGMEDDYHRQYYADKGKDITRYNDGKVGDVRMVHTSHGIVPGVMMGLAGKGESIYNPTDGTASVYEEGRKRVDNIPTGVPLKGFDKGREWANTIIFGNMKNPLTGNSFADDAKPYSKILEQIEKDDNMQSLSKHTKEVNRKNAMNKLNLLASMQSLTRFNCGKNRYDEGKPNWTDYATTLLPHLGQFGVLIGSRRNYDPAHRLSYVPDGTESEMKALSSLRVDPTQALKNIDSASRQARYNILNTGGLSSALKADLMQSNMMQAATSRNNVQNEYDQKNIGLMQAALQASIAGKQNSAQRLQSAIEQAIARNDRAQAIDDNYRSRYYADWASHLGSIGKDLASLRQYNDARDYKNKIIKTYYQDMNNKKYGMFLDALKAGVTPYKTFNPSESYPNNGLLDLDKMLKDSENGIGRG